MPSQWFSRVALKDADRVLARAATEHIVYSRRQVEGVYGAVVAHDLLADALAHAERAVEPNCGGLPWIIACIARELKLLRSTKARTHLNTGPWPLAGGARRQVSHL